MTEQDKLTIINLWNNRVPVSHIVHLLPYKQHKIYSVIKSLKENGTLNEDNRIPPKCDRIVSMYNSGIKDIDKLAEMFQCTRQFIFMSLHKQGIHIAKPKQYKKHSYCDKTIEIVAELKEGKTQTEVAKNHNVSRQYVFKIYNKYVKEK